MKLLTTQWHKRKTGNKIRFNNREILKNPRSSSAFKWRLLSDMMLFNSTVTFILHLNHVNRCTSLIKKHLPYAEERNRRGVLKAFLEWEGRNVQNTQAFHDMHATDIVMHTEKKEKAWSGIGWLYGWRTSNILPYLWVVSSITAGQSLIYQLHDSTTDLSTNIRQELFGLHGNPDKHFIRIHDSQSHTLTHEPVTSFFHGILPKIQVSFRSECTALPPCSKPVSNA